MDVRKRMKREDCKHHNYIGRRSLLVRWCGLGVQRKLLRSSGPRKTHEKAFDSPRMLNNAHMRAGNTRIHGFWWFMWALKNHVNHISLHHVFFVVRINHKKHMNHKRVHHVFFVVHMNHVYPFHVFMVVYVKHKNTWWTLLWFMWTTKNTWTTKRSIMCFLWFTWTTFAPSMCFLWFM
jgi:hypothetical protein